MDAPATTPLIVDNLPVIEYATSDQQIIKALLMLRHFPLRVDTQGDHQLRYVFGQEDIANHLNCILTNRLMELTITIEDWVRMEYVWTTNLRHVTGSKRTARAA